MLEKISLAFLSKAAITFIFLSFKKKLKQTKNNSNNFAFTV